MVNSMPPKTTKYIHREQSENYLQIFTFILSLPLLQQVDYCKIYSHLVGPLPPLEEEFSLGKVSLLTGVCVTAFLELNPSQSYF